MSFGITSADRVTVLDRRAAFQRYLAESAEVAMQQSVTRAEKNDASASCFGRIFSLLTPRRRARAHRRLFEFDIPFEAPTSTFTSTTAANARSAAQTSTCTEAVTGTSASTLKSVGLGLFGRPRAQPGVVAKPLAVRQLQQVGETLERRISEMDGRVEASRVEAKSHFAAGKQSAALRALRRSKALAKQATALVAASNAIESQSDMLETAGLQREVADALSAGVRGMKKTHKALKDVEAVAEEAADVRDVSEDVQAALSQLGEAYEDNAFDDDDLLGELAAMDQTPDSPAAATAAPSSQPAVVFPKTPASVVAETATAAESGGLLAAE